MLGVTSPEYQTSVGNGAKFANRPETEVLAPDQNIGLHAGQSGRGGPSV